MRLFIFFIAIIVNCTTTFAQTDSIRVWNKWCSRRDTPLLFTAANNVVQVYCPGMKPAEIKLKCSDWAMRIGKPEIKGDTLSVMAMPYPNKGKNMKLTISNAKTNKVLRTVNFGCDSVPKLKTWLGTIRTSEAYKKDILAQLTLKSAFPNSYYSYPYVIKSYTLRVQSPKGMATLNVNGFFITKDVLQEINNAPVGATVEFINIKATCPECVMKTLDDIKIKIK